MRSSFLAIVNSDTEGPFENFGPALQSFYSRYQEAALENLGLEHPEAGIETSCWIEWHYNEKVFKISVDDAWVLAMDLGFFEAQKTGVPVIIPDILFDAAIIRLRTADIGRSVSNMKAELAPLLVA